MRSVLSSILVATSGIGVLAADLAVASNPTPLDVYGVWLTNGRNSKVEIKDCGDATPCGNVVWIDDPSPELLLDAENPRAELRDRPLMALLVLGGFKAKKDQWKKGKIYDPETGTTYGSKLRRRDDWTLEVKGCLGPICQTRIWTLAE